MEYSEWNSHNICCLIDYFVYHDNKALAFKRDTKQPAQMNNQLSIYKCCWH